jgi:membrane-bound lytic murein transglycosylase C
MASLLPYTSRADDFEAYKAEMNAGLFQVEDEFSQYKEKYQAAFSAYQQEITQFWNQVEVSDSTHWVDYNPTMDVKRVLDFSKDEIRISVQGDRLQGFSPKDAEREILAALTMDIDTAYQSDPILAKVVGDKKPDSQLSLLGIDSSLVSGLAQQMSDQAKLSRQAGKQGELLTITAKLPSNSLAKRAYGYVPEVQKAASRWHVPAPLIMAIMHTESAFNPMARSHIPAFGLMQIVPKSAGRDASKLVFGRERLLTGADLYNPTTNIQMGAAYLHILDTRYLKGIKDPASRQLCVIAAYNTGAGNVARAFTGTRSVTKALPLINRLTSKQVYAHLRSNLTYAEAKNYVKKVTQVLPLYSYA